MEDSTSTSTMGPSTLDLFILTFNCAKSFINVPVFAAHLQQALVQNATGLPDLVVLSLQEVSPLSYAFIGGYFLSPYLRRFEEALNLAAAAVENSRPVTPPLDGATDSEPVSAPVTQSLLSRTSQSWSRSHQGTFQLVRSANVGMTAILLFARNPAAIHHIRVAECGFGVADMGNKGAVGLRVTYSDAGTQGVSADDDAEHHSAELTFVATHLAPMEWNLARRNDNWRSIASGLVFADPRSAVPDPAQLDGLGQGLQGRELDSAASAARTPQEEEASEWLLTASQETRHAEVHDTLRDVSVFRPASLLFVAGDLNYRTSSRSPPVGAAFPSPEPGAPDDWKEFLPRDQLTREREAGRAFGGLSEAEIGFRPTYKYVLLGDGAKEAEEAGRPVARKWAGHRWPSWCDRVLYLDVPRWARERLSSGKGGTAAAATRVDVVAYDSLPLMRSSDHQPVFFRAHVPLLTAEELAPPVLSGEDDAGEEGDRAVDADSGSGVVDPRFKLPVPVDVDAWERRAAARRREVVVGWSAFLWSTREGAALMGLLLLAGVGGWWVYQWV